MYHDIQTLTDANASWWDKGLALGDLTASIIMDINMLDGAGEAMQAARIGAQIAEKGAIDVSEMAGKDAAKVVEGVSEEDSVSSPVRSGCDPISYTYHRPDDEIHRVDWFSDGKWIK